MRGMRGPAMGSGLARSASSGRAHHERGGWEYLVRVGARGGLDAVRWLGAAWFRHSTGSGKALGGRRDVGGWGGGVCSLRGRGRFETGPDAREA